MRGQRRRKGTSSLGLLGFLVVSPAWSGTTDRAICTSRQWSLGSANNGLEGRPKVIGRGSVGDHEAFLMSPLAGGDGGRDGLLTYQECRDLKPGHPAVV